MIRVTALLDNNISEHKALTAKHGLSFFVETPQANILFDCGPDNTAVENARRLGRDIADADAVVLSHGHYDHASGFLDLCALGHWPTVLYTGPGFLDSKYATDGTRHTDLSSGITPGFLGSRSITHNIVEGHMEIFPGIHVIGGFPRTHVQETIPERFVVQRGGKFVPDDFSDEVCIAFTRPDGIRILCGCCHPGILNMAAHVRNVLRLPVREIFGGTHLKEADAPRIATTLAELRDMGLQTVGLSHCSGETAEQELTRAGIRGCHLATGDCIFFE